MNAAAQPLSWSRDLAWALTIGLLALALRFTCAREYGLHPLGRLPWVDEGAYAARAIAILGGLWVPDQPFYQDPLYPYLLALQMRIAGQDVAMLRLCGALLGAVTPLVVWWTGRRWLGPAEGVLAGLITALYGPLIFADGLLEKESVAALVAACSLALSAWAAESKRRVVPAVLAGIAWGSLSLLRANALILLPVVAIWWLARRELGPLPNRALRACEFLAGFVLVLIPSAAMNAAVGRPPELILTTWQLGPNFYIGNGPEANGTYVAPSFVTANPAFEADDFTAEAQRRSGSKLSPARVSRYWLAAGLRQWHEKPETSLRLLARKVGLLLHDGEIPDNQNADVVRAVAAPSLALGFLSFAWIAPWAAMGLARVPRNAFWWLIVSTTACGLGSTALFFIVGRYRIPWIPGLALLASCGAVDAARLLRDHAWRRALGRGLLLAIPAACLALRPIPDLVPDRWGHAEIELGVAYLMAGELEPAIDAFDDACALGPGPAARVGELLRDGPVHAQMAALVGRRLERHEQLTNVPAARLARWWRQLPSTRDTSRAILESALQDNPSAARLRYESAAWWLGEPIDPAARDKAAAELQRALGREPADAAPAILLALITREPNRLPATARGARSRTRLRLAATITRK